MNTQPEALRLADALMLERPNVKAATRQDAAAELRRLHKTNQNSIAALTKANEQTEHFERLWYLRGDLIEELVEALDALIVYTEACEGMLNASPAGQVISARAALTKARGTE